MNKRVESIRLALQTGGSEQKQKVERKEVVKGWNQRRRVW